ncbi:MAG: PepSY-associated TM helix domain-containing protein [Mucilaginibacter sp.]|uniref:PepSY-associated TM helix domain-containing protein n=1 Tax=Mucilaginibacter sp. TaxID=1882438 RepID=UPI003266FFA5
MTTLKKAILFLHRWLGFISGLVVFIVSVTGCLFAFQDEIQDALYSYRKVEVQHKPYLPPSQIKQIALQKYPTGESSIVAYYGPNRPAAAMVTIPKAGTHYIFINPYSGQFLHDENIARNFFVIVEFIHLYLLLPPAIGQMIVGISVIIFVIIMITGIILWWPKRKTDRKRSFTIKWNGRWRRVNYDLHNVLGFYACAIAIILAISGLSIAFDWVRTGIYNTANLGKSYAFEKSEVKSDSTKRVTINQSIGDKAFAYSTAHSPEAKMFFISQGGKKSKNNVSVTAYYKSMHYYKSDSYVFDKYSGNLLKILPHTGKSAGMKINEMNYDIHVGQILGLTGKIIAFIASLICASLPITGFIIWLGKRNKKRHKKPRARLAV